MKNLLPVLLIFALLPLSHFGQQQFKKPFVIVLASALGIYFLLMAAFDSEYLYPHLFFALLAVGFALRGLRGSGYFGERGSKV